MKLFQHARFVSLIAMALGPVAAMAGTHGLKAGVNPVKEDRTATWLEARQEIFGMRLPARPVVVPGEETASKVVALTFDDGPHTDTTPALVQELRQADAPATFFVIGKQVDKHPEMVRLETENGFEVGNHSYSHATLTHMPVADMLTEFKACDDAIVRAGGREPRFCRPPGGDLDSQVERAATANGLRTALWTDDPGDYANPGPHQILKQTLANLSDGGIILLHDGTQETVDVLPKLIAKIRARGYRIVPLSELPARRA